MRDHTVVKSIQRTELARRTGCNLETVRYYEKVGLIPEPPRTTGGYRSCDATHEGVSALFFGLASAASRFTKSVSFCISLTSATNPAPMRAVAAAHLDDIRAKIADLKRMERVLKDVVALCSDDMQRECPLIETLFREPR